MLKSKGIKGNEIQSARTVLVEKTNPIFQKALDQLTKVSLFSTTVVPMSNHRLLVNPQSNKTITHPKVLVYQESKKAAHYIFGSTTPKIVLARVIILDMILSHTSVFNRKPEFSIDHNLYANSPTSKILFGNAPQFSASYLVAIPASAKIEFVKSCLICHKLGYRKDDIDLPSESRMEHIPVWKIPSRFSLSGLDSGTWLEEFSIKKHPYGAGNTLQHSEKANISLFRSWVGFYDKGLWNTVTNGRRNLNKQLNKL